MLLEDQRFIHEDLERLEQGIADRVIDDPRNVRDLHHLTKESFELANRDHRYERGCHETTKSPGF